jgi:hypothetical protein
MPEGEGAFNDRVWSWELGVWSLRKSLKVGVERATPFNSQLPSELPSPNSQPPTLRYAYLTQRINSLMLGRLPVIRRPTR